MVFPPPKLRSYISGRGERAFTIRGQLCRMKPASSQQGSAGTGAAQQRAYQSVPGQARPGQQINKLSLSLSLSLTHTHTHTRIPPFTHPPFKTDEQANRIKPPTILVLYLQPRGLSSGPALLRSASYLPWLSFSFSSALLSLFTLSS